MNDAQAIEALRTHDSRINVARISPQLAWSQYGGSPKAAEYTYVATVQWHGHGNACAMSDLTGTKTMAAAVRQCLAEFDRMVKG